MAEKQSYPISDIRVPVKRVRTLDKEKVLALAEDILENGQKVAISIRTARTGFVLIEGYHRLEALKALGEETVEAYLVHARLH
jgi:ParB-like chromosome segregation protein Spo0J